MPLDVEISILRGFVTPSEATTWKQNFLRTAGEIPGEMFIISTH